MDQGGRQEHREGFLGDEAVREEGGEEGVPGAEGEGEEGGGGRRGGVQPRGQEVRGVPAHRLLALPPFCSTVLEPNLEIIKDSKTKY